MQHYHCATGAGDTVLMLTLRHPHSALSLRDGGGRYFVVSFNLQRGPERACDRAANERTIMPELVRMRGCQS
jgi:hypothetical protein